MIPIISIIVIITAIVKLAHEIFTEHRHTRHAQKAASESQTKLSR